MYWWCLLAVVGFMCLYPLHVNMDYSKSMSVQQVRNFVERSGGEVSDVQKYGGVTTVISHYREVPDVTMPYNVSAEYQPPNCIEYTVR